MQINLKVPSDAGNFSRRFAKRVKALGGKYSECRGHTTSRWIEIPLSRAGIALADEIWFAPSVIPVNSPYRRRTFEFPGVPHGSHEYVISQRSGRESLQCFVRQAAARRAGNLKSLKAQKRRTDAANAAKSRQNDERAVSIGGLQAGERLAAAFLLEHCS